MCRHCNRVCIRSVYTISCAVQNTACIQRGGVDAEFKVSSEDFLEDIQKAEAVWEKAAGKDLFTYVPDAAFNINLIYDQRQQVTDTAKTLTTKLSETARQQETIKQQYDKLHAQYLADEQRYQNNLDAYDADSKALARAIQEYNESGASSREQYNELQLQQKELQSRGNILEKERVALNTLAGKVNVVAKKDSQIVQIYNTSVKQFNDVFAGKREFEQGEYTGRAITIYEFSKHSDLQLVLGHELGHALGIGHVENPASVMYPLVSDKNSVSRGLSKEDKAALSEVCAKNSFEVFLQKLHAVPIFNTLIEKL